MQNDYMQNTSVRIDWELIRSAAWGVGRNRFNINRHFVLMRKDFLGNQSVLYKHQLLLHNIVCDTWLEMHDCIPGISKTAKEYPTPLDMLTTSIGYLDAIIDFRLSILDMAYDCINHHDIITLLALLVYTQTNTKFTRKRKLTIRLVFLEHNNFTSWC